MNLNVTRAIKLTLFLVLLMLLPACDAGNNVFTTIRSKRIEIVEHSRKDRECNSSAVSRLRSGRQNRISMTRG